MTVPPDLGQAPDLELLDTQGRLVRLADFRDRHAVVLVFLRGFT